MTFSECEKKALKECGRPKRYSEERILRMYWKEHFTQEMIADVCKISVITVRKVLRANGASRDLRWGTIW